MLLAFLVSSSLTYSQEQTIQAKFIIQDAKIDGVDFTETVISNAAYLAFYTIKGSKDVYFTNHLTKANSQSYGKIFDLDGQTYAETDSTYKFETYTFRWSYVNTYDDKTGTAKVTLEKTHKPAGVAFECKIIAENLDILEYKGYMEGSLRE